MQIAKQFNGALKMALKNPTQTFLTDDLIHQHEALTELDKLDEFNQRIA